MDIKTKFNIGDEAFCITPTWIRQISIYFITIEVDEDGTVLIIYRYADHKMEVSCECFERDTFATKEEAEEALRKR